MPRARIAAPSMLALALLAAGCTTTTPSEPTPSTAATTDANDYGATLAPSIDSPSWEPADAERAGTEAAAALTAFTRKGLSDDVWWAELKPHLTNAAQEAYAYTDPTTVPGRYPTNGDVAQMDGSGFLATCAIRTDAGTYTVRLSRTGTGDPWLVDHFDLPPEDGG